MPACDPNGLGNSGKEKGLNHAGSGCSILVSSGSRKKPNGKVNIEYHPDIAIA